MNSRFTKLFWLVIGLVFATCVSVSAGQAVRDRSVSAYSALQSFENGVASGDVTSDGAVLWARSTQPGPVTFRYSTDGTFTTVDGTAVVTASSSLLPVKIAITQLTANTRYLYQAIDAEGITATGSFRTSATSGHHGLRFGVSGDWRGELSPYPSIRNAPGRDLDFFIEHGDTIYADVPSPAVPAGPATTLDQFRAKYGEVFGERFGLNAWANLRASTSVLAMIDDHEVTNDFAGGAPPASDSRFLPSEAAFINDTTLFEDGLQAFSEYHPISDERYGATGDERTAGERKLYRYRTYGTDAAIMLLDTRSFRDSELAPVQNPLDPAQRDAFIKASFDTSRTLLGRAQVEELKHDLRRAQDTGITWKFILVPEPAQNLGVGGASDRFEGYAAERSEILSFIDDQHITNVVFVSADIHGTLVNNLTYQTAAGGPQIALDAFEITTGPVAYDAPFGPTVVGLAAANGLLTPAQVSQYNALPRDQKDSFVQNLINLQLSFQGYDPIGLQASPLQATLLQGSYTAVHSFGWSEFAIDSDSQALTVTTYGIDSYTAADLQADPQGIAARQPAIISQFRVIPALENRLLLPYVIAP